MSGRFSIGTRYYSPLSISSFQRRQLTTAASRNQNPDPFLDCNEGRSGSDRNPDLFWIVIKGVTDQTGIRIHFGLVIKGVPDQTGIRIHFGLVMKGVPDQYSENRSGSLKKPKRGGKIKNFRLNFINSQSLCIH